MDRGRAARIHHTCTSCTQRHATRVKGRRNSHHSRAQVPPCTLAFTCSTLAGASLIRRCCSHGKGRAGRAQTKGGATFLARGRPVWEPVALCAAAVVRSAVQGCCCLVCVAGCAQRAAAQPQQDKIPSGSAFAASPYKFPGRTQVRLAKSQVRLAKTPENAGQGLVQDCLLLKAC
jgi:hypothetical protein